MKRLVFAGGYYPMQRKFKPTFIRLMLVPNKSITKVCSLFKFLYDTEYLISYLAKKNTIGSKLTPTKSMI